MSRGVSVGGKRYRMVVLRAIEWDEQGRPSKVLVGYDDTTFKVDGNRLENEFWTCLVPMEMSKLTRRDN